MAIGDSHPKYPHRHGGAVLVCGNAWCLLEDVAAARQIFPAAPAIVVNGASGHVDGFALFSLHTLRMERWKATQQERFPGPLTLHSAGNAETAARIQSTRPCVDHCWEGASGSGTSTWGARKMAGMMGFNLVVLCGMPLEIGPYQGRKMAKPFMNRDTVEHYRSSVAADESWHAGCRSMSGWTRSLLGEP